MMVVFALLLEIGCTALEGNGPGAGDDTGIDDSGPRDDTGPGDDSGARQPFEVDLTFTPTMVTQVWADITVEESHALVVTCEAPTSDPWPERIVARSPDSRRSHSVFIGGLLAETTYTCTADDEGQILGTFEVTTDTLPPEIDFVKPTVEFDDPNAFALGWTLYNPTRHDLAGSPTASANMVLDPMGRIRWYKDASEYDGHAIFEYDVASQEFYGGGGMIEVQPLTAWDTAGNVLFEWRDVIPDHDVEKVGDDYYMIALGPDGIGGTHCLEQYSSQGKLVWSWCSEDDASIPYGAAKLESAVQATPKGTFLYATMQVRGVVYKLNRDTKEVEWVWGEGEDFEGDIPYAAWMHDLDVIDCPGYSKCLLMYVNGTEEDPTTWIRQIGIDEDKMTTAVVREWTEKDWQEPRVGGIDLVGDHWLVCEGHFLAEPLNERRSQIVEVAPDDSVVWRLIAGSDDIQMYRARRVGACALFGHAGYCPVYDQ